MMLQLREATYLSDILKAWIKKAARFPILNRLFTERSDPVGYLIRCYSYLIKEAL